MSNTQVRVITVDGIADSARWLEIIAGTGIDLNAVQSGRKITITIEATGGGGTSDHAALAHLDYASSGHTGFVPSARTVNGHALSADVTVTASDVGALGATATAGGDLSGSYPNPGVAKVSGTTPGTFGLARLGDATQADARTALGLGSAAYTSSGAYDAYGSAAAAQAASQPLDADLTTIGGLAGARGAIMVRDSLGNWSILSLGTSGQVLQSNGTDLIYGSVGGASLGTILTTQGDLMGRDATTVARIPIGADGSLLGAVAGLTAYVVPPWVATCDDIVTICAASSSGHYERSTDFSTVIVAKPQRVPIFAIADAITNPPPGRSWLNSANLTSAYVTASSNKLSLNAKVGTATDLNGVTNTAPVLYRSYTRKYSDTMSSRPVIFGPVRISSASTLVNARWAGIYVRRSGSYTNYARLQFGYDGAKRVYTECKGASTAGAGVATIATGLEAGVWAMLVVWQNRVTTLYSLASSCPTTYAGWTIRDTDLNVFASSDNALEFGIYVHTSTETATAFVADFEFLDDRGIQDESGPSPYFGKNVTPCFGYATTGDTIPLVKSWNFRTKTTPNITALRLALADAVNRLPGDAAAWTFSCTGSASANPAAATTFQAAASLDLKQPGTDTAASAAGYQYWALHAICSSASGLQPGSIDTALIRMVV